MHAFGLFGSGLVVTQSTNSLITDSGAVYPQLTTWYPVPQAAGAGRRDVDCGSSVARIEDASGLHLSNASPSVNVAPGVMYSCVIAKKRFVLRKPGFAGGEGGGGGKDGDGGGDGEANSFPGTNAICHRQDHY